MTDLRQTSYNKLELLPDIPASIVAYLIDNNELVFKLLYYNTSDAWNKPDLNAAQKRALIYNGTGRVEDARIFLDTGQDSALVDQVSLLRISVVSYTPVNHVYGHTDVGIEVYCHYLLNALSNYQVRADLLIQSVIATINGAEIENTSRLYFDASRNPRCKISVVGTPPFKGKAALLSTWNA